METCIEDRENVSAEELMAAITAACKNSMTRGKQTTGTSRKEVYWWREEIGQARKACIKK